MHCRVDQGAVGHASASHNLQRTGGRPSRVNSGGRAAHLPRTSVVDPLDAIGAHVVQSQWIGGNKPTGYVLSLRIGESISTCASYGTPLPNSACPSLVATTKTTDCARRTPIAPQWAKSIGNPVNCPIHWQ